MKKDGTRAMSAEQRNVVNQLKARCAQMFQECPTHVQESGGERLYTTIRPMHQHLPDARDLANVLESNGLNIQVDVSRKGDRAHSTHFRLTHDDLNAFASGQPLQLSVLSDVANGRNDHGRIVIERTAAGQFGRMHYEVAMAHDQKKFRLV